MPNSVPPRMPPTALSSAAMAKAIGSPVTNRARPAASSPTRFPPSVSPPWKATTRPVPSVSRSVRPNFRCSTNLFHAQPNEKPVGRAAATCHGNPWCSRSEQPARSFDPHAPAARAPALGSRARPVSRQVVDRRPALCSTGRGRRHARRHLAAGRSIGSHRLDPRQQRQRLVVHHPVRRAHSDNELHLKPCRLARRGPGSADFLVFACGRQPGG